MSNVPLWALFKGNPYFNPSFEGLNLGVGTDPQKGYYWIHDRAADKWFNNLSEEEVLEIIFLRKAGLELK